MPTPATDRCVLVLTRTGDGEAGAVADLLRRIGIPVVRLDADRLADTPVLCAPDGRLEIGGRPVRPAVLWRRHFDVRAAAAPAGAGAALAAGAAGLLHRDSWSALVRQLPLLAPVVIGREQPGQLDQLRRATALGLRVPRTSVTTDVQAARERLGGSRHVVKVLDRHFVEPEPGHLHWFLPVVLGPATASPPPPPPPPFDGRTPVVVQEFVPHDRELRLYLAGTELYAFEITKERPEDLWTRPDSVRVRPVPVPPPVGAAARRLARAYGLRYAAFDFLMERRQPVFLELGVHGDWRWFERRAGVDTVTRAVARAVAALHREHAGAPGRVDLLSFLGAGLSR